MLAIDIGGSHIASVNIEDVKAGRISGNLNNDHVDYMGWNKEEILNVWVQNMSRSINSTYQFDGHIAIAIPSPFDFDQGIVEPHPNGKFRVIEGVNLKEELFKRLSNCEQLYFENDATCFGIGEYYYGQKERLRKILAVTLGTGIGSAFIDRGNVIRNSNSVPYGGEVYNLPFNEMTADDYFSTRWFVKESIKYDLQVSGVKELVTGDNKKVAHEIFEKFIANFKLFFTPLAMNFEAEAIVIGGNISKAWKYFGPHLVDHFREKDIKVIRSETGEIGICLGAARSMYNHYKL